MSKEISRKQLEVYELTMDDGAKAISLDESMPIIIGYDEVDIRKILQAVFLPDEKPIKDSDALPDEQMFSLLREAANILEERLEVK